MSGTSRRAIASTRNETHRICGPLCGYVVIILPVEHNDTLLVCSAYHFTATTYQIDRPQEVHTALSRTTSGSLYSPRDNSGARAAVSIVSPPSRNLVDVGVTQVRECSRLIGITSRSPECQPLSENAIEPLPSHLRCLATPQCANANHIKPRNLMCAYGTTRRPRGDWRARNPFHLRSLSDPFDTGVSLPLQYTHLVTQAL